MLKFQALEDKMQELEKGVQANNIEIKGQGRSSFSNIAIAISSLLPPL